MATNPRPTPKRPKEPTVGSLKAQLLQAHARADRYAADYREIRDKLAKAEATVDALAAALVGERQYKDIPF